MASRDRSPASPPNDSRGVGRGSRDRGRGPRRHTLRVARAPHADVFPTGTDILAPVVLRTRRTPPRWTP